QHVDDLLEIEQPERQFQVARIEHQRALAEAAAIFVVDVEQEDTQDRPRLEDFVQQQRHAGRFADAGRAEHRKMLGQHFLDIDIDDNGRILLQGADIDLVRPARRIDRAQLLVVDEVDGVADGRVIGDAALEFLAVRGPQDFAEQVDRGGGDVGVRTRQMLAGYFGDHGDDRRIRAADADEAADRGPYLGGAQFAGRPKLAPGEGAEHRN